jgi:hypothetical protein
MYSCPITYSSDTFHVDDSILNNQQTMYNFLQTMNTTLVTGQEYIKSHLDDVWDYVNEIMDNLYGMVIS